MQSSASAFRLFRRLTPSLRLKHFHGRGQPRTAMRCTICSFPFHRSVLQPGQFPPSQHLARSLASRRNTAGIVQCSHEGNGAGRHLLPAGHANQSESDCSRTYTNESIMISRGCVNAVQHQGARRNCPRPSSLRRRSRASMTGGRPVALPRCRCLASAGTKFRLPSALYCSGGSGRGASSRRTMPQGTPLSFVRRPPPPPLH